ncbi:transporter [Mycobacterium sp. 852013-50091_SCH5140682]|uniref:bile acid:sodium symporter family protein n=1 Tax=Mycobacterium sp. 852013-50091_SCH5140682 TaxID=1834109 RepID=UPI0007EB3A00|nr:bile acid:sodium symporter [Mycobacterium sp. 852013-50091_SCH5140682]OBC02425.1 transporter [Mycobacterium sp. 852013-50091_SCH5140682]
MEVTDLLLQCSNIAVVFFVVSSTLSVGLSLTVPQILAPLKNTRLVALCLVANFVLAPLAALGLWKALGLDEPLGIGLLLAGLAAGAPFLIKLAEFAKADIALAVGLMVLLMVVTVGYVPLVLPLLVQGAAVNPVRIAASLVVLMLVPLAIGLALRARSPGIAGRIRPAVGVVSNVSMVLVVLLTVAGHFRSVVSVFGTFAVLAAVMYTAVCAGIGWLVAVPGTRDVLALGTAQRNAAAAFVVAGQNFDDARVIVMITVVLIVEFLMLLPFSAALARR